MVYIETPRLLLRDWEEEDFVVFSEMNSSPSVMKYFLHPLSEEESLVLFDAVRSDFLRYGYGGYAVEQKSDGAFVGFTGFHNFSFDVDFAPGIEIAWRLKQEYWNRGYATEAEKPVWTMQRRIFRLLRFGPLPHCPINLHSGLCRK